jgi:hypothetical protein
MIMLIPMVLLAFVIIIFGVLPNLPLAIIRPAVAMLGL